MTDSSNGKNTVSSDSDSIDESGDPTATGTEEAASESLVDSVKGGLKSLELRQTSLDVRSHLARLAQNRDVQAEAGELVNELVHPANKEIVVVSDEPQLEAAVAGTTIDEELIALKEVSAHDSGTFNVSSANTVDNVADNESNVSDLDSEIANFNRDCEALSCKSNWRDLCSVSEQHFGREGLQDVARLWWVSGQLEQGVVPPALLSGPAEAALNGLIDRPHPKVASSAAIARKVAERLATCFDEERLFLQSLPLWELAIKFNSDCFTKLTVAAKNQLELDSRVHSKRDRKDAEERRAYLEVLAFSGSETKPEIAQRIGKLGGGEVASEWRLGEHESTVRSPDDSGRTGGQTREASRAMVIALLLLSGLVAYELASLDEGRFFSFQSLLKTVLGSDSRQGSRGERTREPLILAEVQPLPELKHRQPSFEQMTIKSQFGLGSILKDLQKTDLGSDNTNGTPAAAGVGMVTTKPVTAKRAQVLPSEAKPLPAKKPPVPKSRLPELDTSQDTPTEPSYVDRAIDAYDRGEPDRHSGYPDGNGYDRGQDYRDRYSGGYDAGNAPQPKPSSPYMVQGEPIPRMPGYYDEDEPEEEPYRSNFGQFYRTTESVEVREGPYEFAPPIARLRPNSRVEVERDYGAWLKILSENGRVGFIPKYSARPAY